MTRPSFTTYAKPSGRRQLHLMWYEGGKRCQRKAGTFPTKAQAEAAGKTWLADVVRGEAVQPSRFTVDNWLDRWLELCRLAELRPRTIYDYSGKLRLHVRPEIGELLLEDVEPVHLDGIYATMSAKGLAPRTIRYVHSIVHKSFADAVRKDLLVVNPAGRATPPRARAARAAERPVWTPDQLRTFLAALDGHQFEAALHVLATTALRRSEALALRWAAIDFDAATIEVRAGLTNVGPELHLRGPKTPRGHRRIDIDAGTVNVLRSHRARQAAERLLVGAGYQDQDLVFARPDGQPWKPDSLTASFRRLVAELGLPAIRMHDLRHGHASYLLALGTDPNTVADRLGHATAGFTVSTYGHSLPGRQAEAARRVADLIKGAANE
jgi:integrase